MFNVAPQNLSLDVSSSEIDENGQIFLAGSFDDPGILDTHVVRIDWGDGSPATIVALDANVLSFSDIAHTYRDDPDNESELYVITVEVVDDDEPLAPTIANTNVHVRNVVPRDVQVHASAAQIQENGVITLDGSFFDPGPVDAHTVQIDWGDGSQPVVLQLPPAVHSFTGIAHRYADDSGPAAFVITVRVADDDAPLDLSSGTTSVRVVNVAPVVESLAINEQGPIDEGSLITVSGMYSDVGLRDRHTVEVYWGSERLGVASVDSAHRSFSFTHRLQDDNPSGTAWDAARIEVRVLDDEGGVGVLQSAFDLQVNNVPPRLELCRAPKVPNAVQLSSRSRIPGSGHVHVRLDRHAGGIPFGTPEIGTDLYARSQGTPQAVFVVTLTVTDDDTGDDSLSTAVVVGTS